MVTPELSKVRNTPEDESSAAEVLNIFRWYLR
jgi:hypothetical protein